MRILFKVLGILGGAVLTGLGIKKAYDYYKNIDEIDKATQEKLDELGISQEALEEIDPYDSNEFVKSLYVAVSKNPDFDIDVISNDYDEAFWKNSIHVLSTNYQDRNESIKKKFTMYFSIPDFTENNDIPGLKVFINGFNEALDIIQTKIIKNQGIWAKKELVGLVSYGVPIKEKGIKLLKVAEIEPEIYESFRDEEKNNNGLSNFYKAYKRCKKSKDSDDLKWIQNIETRILDNTEFNEEKEDPFAAVVYDISLAYKVSYNIESINCAGINWDKALCCLKFLVNNLEFNHQSCLNRDDKSPILYNHIMFHCLDEYDDPELYRFYDTDKNGKIIEVGFELD